MLSTYSKNKMIDHILGTSEFTMPTQVYIGLFTTAPINGVGGIEVSGDNYARQIFDANVAVNGIATNSILIEFPIATSNWGTVVAAGVWDANTNGNLLLYDLLESSKEVKSGKQYQFDIGNVRITMI